MAQTSCTTSSSSSSGGNTIVKLNVGGKIYQTTEATLCSKGPNFFSTLMQGNIPSTKDETGAYFIDRNGRLFEAILDYLRTGSLIVPPTMSLQAILQEASFYCIDVSEALCKIPAGLYSSSGDSSRDAQSWLLLLQRDPARPGFVGVTGIFGNHIVYEQPCPVLPGGTIDLISQKKPDPTLTPAGTTPSPNSAAPLQEQEEIHLHISLAEDDPSERTLICRDVNSWHSSRRLIWKQEPCTPGDAVFPLSFNSVWTFSPNAGEGQVTGRNHIGRKIQVRFDPSQDHGNDTEVMMRISYPDGVLSYWSVTPLCRSLLLVQASSGPIGLIYISGHVVFFIECNSYNGFAVHALKNITASPPQSPPPVHNPAQAPPVPTV